MYVYIYIYMHRLTMAMPAGTAGYLPQHHRLKAALLLDVILILQTSKRNLCDNSVISRSGSL